MSKIGIVYAKEVPMIKVKQVKEINGKGTPLHTVIQYWTIRIWIVWSSSLL